MRLLETADRLDFTSAQNVETFLPTPALLTTRYGNARRLLATTVGWSTLANPGELTC